MSSLQERFAELSARLLILEERFHDLGYDTKNIVKSELKTHWKIPAQAETMFGLHTAICVDTEDPLSGNRVRFFSPLLHEPNIKIKQLPWAYPISSLGGFDDSGVNWVPPAGSKLVLAFEGGNRQMPFYLGTTWDKDRGPDGQHKWNFPVQEYYDLHEGNRDGYMVGPDDGSQVYPPWNSESYNGYDYESTADLEQDPDAKDKRTYPSIFGFKTVGKSFLQFADGDYKNNMKWARVVLQSTTGHSLLLKDDPSSDCGDWTNPEIGGSNPYHKHKSDGRLYKGSGSPSNTKCELEQSGIQITSRGGATLIFDDSVEEPNYTPDWKASMQDFNFGDMDRAMSKVVLKSITGHEIILDDIEDISGTRGEDNGIRLESALGNKIKLIDYTEQCPCGENEGSAKGGVGRGIRLESTSGNEIIMEDGDNKHCACRDSNHEVVKDSKSAYIKLKTGYGLEIMMSDNDSQEETKSQYIELRAPQKDSCAGPHYIRLQEDKEGGQVQIRSAGDFINSVAGNHMTVVGGSCEEAECLGTKNKITMVSGKDINVICDIEVRKTKSSITIADEYVILGAGKDCPDEEGGMTPCFAPVLVYQNGRIMISDRVFASCSQDANVASIFSMSPFISGGA